MCDERHIPLPARKPKVQILERHIFEFLALLFGFGALQVLR